MSDPEISALAREYAELTDGSPADISYITAIAENTIRFLLRRFCLVEKKDVEAKYRQAKERYSDTNADDTDTVMYGGRISLLEYLFPEIV